MKEVDITTWKEYNLYGKDGLFECFGSKTTPKLQLEQKGEGIYPYVTTQATNNGIQGYYNFFTELGNVLTIDSAVLGTCFYQSRNFSASDHVEILSPKFKMTKYIALFLSTILNKNGEVLGYAYNLKRSQSALKEEKIKLPSKLNEKGEYEPDWQYMEDYVKALQEKVQFNSANLNLSAKSEKANIDCTYWKEFKLGGHNGLFNIILPTGDIQAQKTNIGIIPLISSGKNNNGICKYIEETAKSNIIQSNTITIDMFGKAFYHDYKYYSVSHGRVNILIPKFSMTKHIGLYIASVIEIFTTKKYNFLNMCSQKALMNENIKLPAKLNEKGEYEPDWQYMEKCINQIKENAQQKMSSLQQSIY